MKHANIVGEYRKANLYTAHIGGVYGPGAQFIGVLAQAMIVFVGGHMVLDGKLSYGDFAAFSLYLTRLFAPIQQLAQLYNTYQQGRAGVLKLRDLFSTNPSVREKPGARELPPIEGEITLQNVTFGYNPSALVLENVDLTITSGETFALVGPTGAGKSTIAKLLTRFYDPLEGKILVDGYDISDVTLHSLRSQLGVVPQESFLFAGSIGDNIQFARPQATREDVLAACDAVGILELINSLPQGLDTPCHERGVTLSSGERQLIALARAFLAAPRADPRRGHLQPRPRDRVAHRTRPRRAARRAHRSADRAPAQHRDAGRSDRSGGGRPARGGRSARGPHRHERSVRRDVHRVAEVARGPRLRGLTRSGNAAEVRSPEARNRERSDPSGMNAAEVARHATGSGAIRDGRTAGGSRPPS